MSKIIAVNAGSSSLKFQLFNMPEETVITSGNIERIGFEDAIFTIKVNGEKVKTVTSIPDHSVAVKMLLEALVKHQIVASYDEIDACGHRVVQGGPYFSDSCIVDADSEAKVEELAELAPLHNPANLVGMRAFREALPHAKHVFVFDTAFHQTMDEERYLYALPYEYYTKYQVRRYGAHGTSHKYVSGRVIDLLGNPEHSKIIVCHLGNGASLSAVKDGQCIDTSMGFTPLAGVMMGTRSGDVDPSILPYVMRKENLNIDEMLNVLNKKSGMLGVSGISSDSRDIEEAYEKGDPAANRTSHLYARIVSKFIGSYFVELGGVDAIAFTAGLGENAAYIRTLVIKDVEEALGVHLDEDLNAVRSGDERVISTADSKVKVMVIPTNEEVMIARDTVRILGL